MLKESSLLPKVPGDLSVKLNLLKAVQTILAVAPEQIEIFEMKIKVE